jgi:hypothetical protein
MGVSAVCRCPPAPSRSPLPPRYQSRGGWHRFSSSTCAANSWSEITRPLALLHRRLRFTPQCYLPAAGRYTQRSATTGSSPLASLARNSVTPTRQQSRMTTATHANIHVASPVAPTAANRDPLSQCTSGPATLPPTNAPPIRPTAPAAKVSRLASTIRLADCAPSARRMPISFVRRRTTSSTRQAAPKSKARYAEQSTLRRQTQKVGLRSDFFISPETVLL